MCPSLEQLDAALRGPSTASENADLAAHLAECPACQGRLETMAGGSNWIARQRQAFANPPAPASDALRRAMQALDSVPPRPSEAPPVQPRLDFLQPSEQPGVLGGFGPYEVLDAVAGGGMGIVLKARDPALNRIVALKILPPARASNPAARARFLREARAAAAVVHDHVVPIYAVDEHNGLPYLVMQFIMGRSLAERIRESGPLSLEQILRIGAQTATGLAAAHAQGLIHRDVKPGNILLENSVERVKITDFGLARAVEDSSLTHEGQIAGTPEYMSPEQAQAGAVDQRSDLFSLGCVLYEIATGLSPFRAERPVAALRRVCDEEPQPAHLVNRAVPEWLGRLIQRLMAKDPAARPASAADVAEELAECLAEVQQSSDSRPFASSSMPVPQPHRPVLKLPLWVLSLVLLMPIALGLVLFRKKKPDPAPALPGPSPVKPIAAAEADAAPARLFFLPAAGDQPERGFATLGEAVAEAGNGAVIEFRFNGVQPVEAVRRIEKALILRAGHGFEPVLSPSRRGQLLLFTHAPLVLEGLTVVIAHVQIPGPPAYQRGSVGIAIEDAPLLLAHCRLEIEPGELSLTPRGPNLITLRNVPSARLLHCELVSRRGFVIEWLVQAGEVPENFATALWFQGCTLEGNGINRGLRTSAAYRLDLRRNTLAGDMLLHLSGGGPEAIPTITASHNVFDFKALLRPFRAAMNSPLKELLRWNGATNIYSVDESYAVTAPAVANHDAWLDSGAVVETNSLRAELELQTRLASLTDRTPAAEAAAFTLTPEERQQLAAQGLDSSTRMGADPSRIGPGQSYHTWRNSPAYEEWLTLVRQHLRQNATGE
jgi:serine/threonine-protein kinase